MMKILIHESVGEDAITLDDGQGVHERIKPELLAGREVELDFGGVSRLFVAFLQCFHRATV